ncbi:Matrix metalloproteinase-16-like protein [Dinothrombium tinctorium]|uniref:Matrix metalloproteinase-16-like protein n=1 Tax=Dinothrombium tinctorium TaxID=1965070 RepID=A0A3S4QSG2_9ACAR|nr:Matrix metalloproteinase-16-like protein [Dinothrombium tinctorium]
MQRFGNIPITGALDEATLELLKRKRCIFPDITSNISANHISRTKRYKLTGLKWKKNDLTWGVKNYTKKMSTRRQFEIFARSFALWSEPTTLNIRYESNPARVDILIGFYRGAHGCSKNFVFDDKEDIVGHAYFPGEGLGGDVHLDDDEDWVDRDEEAINDKIQLFGTFLHEVGHSLGLAHTPVSGAIMYPYYFAIPENFQLPYDDKLGIRALYGVRTANMPRPWMPPHMPTWWTKSPTTTQSVRPKRLPDLCFTSFDAVVEIRSEIYFFKGKEPVVIHYFFYSLPKKIEHIDAVYMRPNGKELVFFTGANYLIYNIEDDSKPVHPRPLTSLGFASNVDKIDAAMIWGYNEKTFFFKGSQYWRFDEKSMRVEADYPRDMAFWKGLPTNIDAAFTWSRNGLLIRRFNC